MNIFIFLDSPCLTFPVFNSVIFPSIMSYNFRQRSRAAAAWAPTGLGDGQQGGTGIRHCAGDGDRTDRVVGSCRLVLLWHFWGADMGWEVWRSPRSVGRDSQGWWYYWGPHVLSRLIKSSFLTPFSLTIVWQIFSYHFCPRQCTEADKNIDIHNLNLHFLQTVVHHHKVGSATHRILKPNTETQTQLNCLKTSPCITVSKRDSQSSAGWSRAQRALVWLT